MARQLTAEEIALLQSRGCRAGNWSRVTVADAFSPGQSFHGVTFAGEVELGVFSRDVKDPDGFLQPAGICRSSLRDAKIGDNCLILDSRVADADISADAVLDWVGLLAGGKESTFANAVDANVLTEDGARAVPLWRSLTSQLAHLLCHQKKHPAAQNLEDLIRRDAESLRSSRSFVGPGARVRRVDELRSVWIGDGAVVEGAAALENCYLEASPAAPVRVGRGVTARDCVFMAASAVEDGAQLSHCLVGEGTVVEGGFAGAHSLFFANSHMALGEASSAFAGPYTVSTHRATLILACQSSFSTFGSGSNASNHLFKLGPRHGGVFRRGVKCGSASYILWPSDIGAYSTVIGRNARHLDTTEFPFSLIMGDACGTTLIPAANLFGAAFLRDAIKWRERDQREKIEKPRDIVNAAILSPYTLQAADLGLDFLKRCTDMEEADLRRGGAIIPTSRFETAIRLYQAALVYHTGERLFAKLAQRLGDKKPTLADIVSAFAKRPHPDYDPLAGRWRDWGGLLLSSRDADKFLADAAEGEFADPDALSDRFRRIHAAYDENEWLWLAARWRRDHGEPADEDARRFLLEWRKAILLRHECFIKDATKEFTPEMKLGFGLEAFAAEYFRRLRGELSAHHLVAMAERDRSRLLALADSVTE